MRAFILAGGMGQRLWPLSTPRRPKQFAKILSDKTLLEQTYDRLRNVLGAKDIFVIVPRSMSHLVREVLEEIGDKNVIEEPFPRGTLLSALVASVLCRDDVILLLPSDHFIGEAEKFAKAIKSGEEFVKKHGGILVFGVKPKWPEPGYGYIEIGEKVAPNIFRIKSFREKPAKEVAESYLAAGNFLWNMGIFMFKPEDFIGEVRAHQPEYYYAISQALEGKASLEEAFSKVQPISIDYGIMEKTERAYVMACDFEWLDIGSWKSLAKILESKHRGLYLKDAERVFVWADKPVAIIGVSNIILVETEDGILVCHEDLAQEVGNIEFKFSPSAS